MKTIDASFGRAAQGEAPHDVAPLSGWRRLASDGLWTGGSVIACQTLGVVTSVALRGLLAPADMGVWQTLKMILSYSNFANLGASKGAARELSVALGRGDHASAERGLGVATTVNTAASLGCAAILLLVALAIGVTSETGAARTWACGFAALSLLVVLQRHVTFQVTVLRAKQDFRTTSELSLVEGVLSLLITVAAVALWGLAGMYAGACSVLAAAACFLAWRGRLRPTFRWEPREARRLVSIGAPILAAGSATVIFRSLDKFAILALASDREYSLGCYSAPLLVTTQLFGLANTSSIVLAPRYAELFGATRDIGRVAHLAARTSELVAAVMALAAALAIVVARPVLEWLLPAYRDGIAATPWLVPSAVLMGMSLPLSQYLVAVSRERLSLIVVAACLPAAAAIEAAALLGGGGLVGLAVATSISYALYYAALLVASLARDLSRGNLIRYVAACGAPIVIVLGTALALEGAWPIGDLPMRPSNDLLPHAIKAAVVLCAWCAVTVGIHRNGPWARMGSRAR